MKCLLDTHSLIWWWLDDPLLSADARSAISAPENHIFVSPVAAIEIGIKVRRGRLPALREPLARFDQMIAQDGFAHLPVTYDHARMAGLLEGAHRDPFDRLLAAQAILEDMAVVTRDPQISEFGARVIW